MAGCIKLPLGMGVGLGPSDIVIWGPTPLQKRAQPPVFGPCQLWPHGCMYQDTTWYGSSPQPRRYCVRWGPSSPSLKGHSPTPHFSANVRCGQTGSYQTGSYQTGPIFWWSVVQHFEFCELYCKFT